MGIGSKFFSKPGGSANIEPAEITILADNANTVVMPKTPEKILGILLNNTPIPLTGNYTLAGNNFTLQNYPVYQNDLLHILYSY